MNQGTQEKLPRIEFCIPNVPLEGAAAKKGEGTRGEGSEKEGRKVE